MGRLFAMLCWMGVALGAAPAAMAQATDRLPVEFVTAAEADVTTVVAVTGTIGAVDSVELGFRQGGRITEVLVDAGDHVSAGQALARTDPLQQQQAVKVAQAALAAARAAQAQAAQAAARAQGLLDRGVGTQARLDQAQQALSSADGAVEQAQAGAERAERALADTVLRAPKDSVVVARAAEPGQIVGAAQAVLSLAALGGLEAVFQIPDSPRLRAAMGRRVDLVGIDIDMPDMVGHVTEISPLVDPRSGSVTVRARIDNPPADTALLGAAVRGRVSFSEGRAVTVPWTALARSGADPAVWLVGDDGRVSLVPVSVGRYGAGAVVLSGGLTPGQIVVGEGSQLLYPGRAVRQAEVTP